MHMHETPRFSIFMFCFSSKLTDITGTEPIPLFSRNYIHYGLCFTGNSSYVTLLPPITPALINYCYFLPNMSHLVGLRYNYFGVSEL